MRIDESLRIVLDGLNESVYFVDMEGKISFVSSFSGRTPTIPPSIVEDLDYERPACCWFCCCYRHDDGV